MSRFFSKGSVRKLIHTSLRNEATLPRVRLLSHLSTVSSIFDVRLNCFQGVDHNTSLVLTKVEHQFYNGLVG